MHEEIDRFVNVERGTVIQLFDEGKGRAQIYVSGVPWFRKLRVLSKARAEFRRLTARRRPILSARQNPQSGSGQPNSPTIFARNSCRVLARRPGWNSAATVGG